MTPEVDGRRVDSKVEKSEFLSAIQNVPIREIVVTPVTLPYPVEQLLVTAAHTDTFKVDKSPHLTHTSSTSSSLVSNSIPISSTFSPSPSQRTATQSPNTNFSLASSKPNASNLIQYHTSSLPPSASASFLHSQSPATSSAVMSTKRTALVSGSSLPSVHVRNAAGDPFHVPEMTSSLDGSISREAVEEYFGHVIRRVILCID